MSINFTKGRYVYMKKIVSAMLAVIIALSVMSISAFAENHDVEVIKKALFEYVYKNDYSYDYKKQGIENLPPAAVDLESITEFLEQYDKDKLAKIDAEYWRDIDKLYKKYLDWYYDNDDSTMEQTDEGWILTDKDGKIYSFVDNGNSWSMIDEKGNETMQLPKLTQFTYLNEDYQDDDSKTEEKSSNKESKSDSSKTSERTRAAANAYKGQKASGKSSKDSSELTDKSSEKQRATTSTTAPVEQESSNIGIYVVMIALIITVGVVIIVVNNNKNKKK